MNYEILFIYKLHGTFLYLNCYLLLGWLVISLGQKWQITQICKTNVIDQSKAWSFIISQAGPAHNV
jgi:hypothetical protein